MGKGDFIGQEHCKDIDIQNNSNSTPVTLKCYYDQKSFSFFFNISKVLVPNTRNARCYAVISREKNIHFHGNRPSLFGVVLSDVPSENLIEEKAK